MRLDKFSAIHMLYHILQVNSIESVLFVQSLYNFFE